MSNYASDYDKLMNRIDVLEERNKELDKDIDLLYTTYGPDEEINKLKAQRLKVVDELFILKQQAEQKYEA